MELKKSLALLATAGSLLAFSPVVSHAQDTTTPAGAASGPFADVPADHWAYNAVRQLQTAGIVIGYPDGTYGGRRPMTRYEFATAIARLLPQIGTGYAKQSDLDQLRSDLEARLAANQAALDALTRLVNEFAPELQQLGQDVTAIQTRLSNLEGRVAVLEAENQRFHVTGSVNFIAEAAGSSHKNGNLGGGYVPFYDKNGVFQPFLNGPNGTVASNRIFEQTGVYHDVLLNLTGKLSDTASVNVDLDFQNYLTNLGNTARAGNPTGESGFGNPGQQSPVGALRNANFNTHVYQAYLEAPIALGPIGGAELKVGRFGEQFTKWTLKQEDADVYTNLYQTDSGNILNDGAALNTKIGPVGANFFAGKFNQTPFSQAFVGTALNATPVGIGSQLGAHPVGTYSTNGNNINHAAPITQAAGARFTLGQPEGLVLGATVEQFAVGSTITGKSLGGGAAIGGFTDPNRSNNGNAPAGQGEFNRVSVYGLDVNGGLPFAFLGKKKGAITVNGAYTVSAQGANNGFNNVGNKTRYQSHEELAGFNLGKLSLQGGYQFVGPYFSAPGYWGKVGAWTNPTNIKGPVYFLKYPITPKLSINADYEQYKAAYATNENGAPVTSPIRGRDHINRYQAGIGYGLTSAYAVDLGYERVEYDLRNDAGTLARSGKPIESYVTLGLGHSFNNNASFKLLYQIVHYNDKGTAFNTGTAGDGNYSGNIAVGQFSLKF